MKTSNKNQNACKIAVIGISCNYPGAKTPLQLWENILAKRRQFREMPEVRLPNSHYYDPDPNVPNKTYQNRAAVIDGFEFDWLGHKIPKQTYESTDIVHWLALDTSLKAIEDTQYSRETLPREKTGVILGNTLTGEFTRSNQMLLRWPFVKKALMASAKNRGYDLIAEDLADSMEEYYKSVFTQVTEDTLAGGLANTIAGRICNFLDLHGGGYIVDGACSSSLIAAITACNMLELGQMDLVIAGGVDISLDTFELIGFAKTGALTPDEMRVYDKNGRGFIPGEGCGMIVLKRYDDAVRDKDFIYATIEGWGISSDGRGGITAPSVAGQSRALIRAYEKSGIDLSCLDFVEGHGTGTTVGDKVELEAISKALGHFGVSQNRKCGVTSFKSIVGHTKAAAGVGALIKAIISVNRRIIPPTAGLKELNPVFYEKAKNIYPILKGEVRDCNSNVFAGISAMGFGGINSHMVISSADSPSPALQPEFDERKLLNSSRSHELFLFSGKTAEELLNNIESCLQYSSGISYAEMTDLSAWQNQVTDHSLLFRAAVITENPFELNRKLLKTLELIRNHGCSEYITGENNTIVIGSRVDSFKIGVVFPGQGSQKLGMALKLADRYEPLKSLIQAAESILKSRGAEGVLDAVNKESYKAVDTHQIGEWQNELKNTVIAQPAITLASLLWFEYLQRFGIYFSCATGHSLGELMAFYAAGMMDLQTLLEFAIFRGKSMAEGGSGSMISLQCSLAEAMNYISRVKGYATVANINGPAQIVLSGEDSAISQIHEMTRKDNINSTILPVSAAFHSELVSKTAGEVRDFEPLKIKTPGKTDIDLISCMTGTTVPSETDLNVYFSEQVTSQVNFVEAIRMMSQKCDMIIEVGPGKVMSSLIPSIENKVKAFPVEISADDDQSILIVVGNLFANGYPVNTDILYHDRFIRDFKPAREKIFIMNPLEREFSVNSGNTQTNLPYETLNKDGDFKNYLSDRGNYIREIIDTDYKYYKQNSIPKTADPVLNEPNEKVLIREERPSQSQEVKTVLYQTLESMTGFSPEVFGGEMKLLDDFNLDSIKSATLLSTVAKKLGITGKLNIQQFSNSSLNQIILHIENILGYHSETGSSNSNEKYDKIRTTVFEKLSNKTGFPADALKPDFRILDDLNLDSIKSGAIIAELSKQFGITGKISHASLSNATILELVESISKHVVTERSEAIENKDKKNPDWINAYTMILVGDTRDYTKKSSLPEKLTITCHQKDVNLAHDLHKTLKSKFASVTVREVHQLKESVTLNESALVVIVPQFHVNHDNTQRMISFLTELNHSLMNVHSITFVEQKYDPAQFSLSSYVASLHLENPAIKYRVIRMEECIDNTHFPDILINEISSPESFESALYNSQYERFTVQYKLVEDSWQTSTGIKLNSDDVVLATGGAKGITAQCVLQMARKYRHKTVLVGTSPANDEINALLEIYKSENLQVIYDACDITDIESIRSTISSIGSEFGKVTAVVHGAGKNIPRRAETISSQNAFDEISPKLIGAMNLCDALKEHKLKTFIALTSIIGITGMKGNSMYAFANESLNLLIKQKSREMLFVPRSFAFSIWDEIGMGARMGSNEVLSAIGIGSIKPVKGVAEFLKWIEYNPGDQQVVIASAMGMLDTWKLYKGNFPKANRYLSEVTSFEPGRSIRTRVKLNGTNDPYLNDHNYNDTLLFPTVFGLEAMTQVSCAMLGIQDPRKIVFENVMLSKPVIVPPDGETVIQIEAELADEMPQKRIMAGIKVEYTDFKEYHFSSEITFPQDIIQETPVSPAFHAVPMKINPELDLYSWLLFQGPKFRLIRNIYDLTPGSVQFSTYVPESNGQPMVLGSAYLRDVLLQSVQIYLTGKRYLPVSVKKWTLFSAGYSAGEGRVESRLKNPNSDGAVCNVDFFVNGELAERIEGYEVKAVASTPGFPLPEKLADLQSVYHSAFSGEFEKYSRYFNQPVFFTVFKHNEAFNRLSPSQRLDLEQEAFKNLLPRFTGFAVDDNAVITRAANGKPCIQGTDLDISISHSGAVLLLTVGKYTQGCDIEYVVNRSEAEWNDLFENKYSDVYEQLRRIDQDPDTSATRIWCAREALIKSTGTIPLSMSIEKVHDQGVILKVGSRDQGHSWVLTFPVHVLPKNTILAGLLIDYKKTHDEGNINMPVSGFNASEQCFVHHFVCTFKDCRGFYGKSHFSAIPDWMGSLRELVLAPLSSELLKDFGSGEFGMVTNMSHIRILNEADSLSEITGKLKITDKTDLSNSFIDLSFEFLRNSPGKPVKLAECNLSTTWVAIEGRGVVKKAPLPEYFKRFIDRYRGSDSKYTDHLNRNFPGNDDLGKLLYEERQAIGHSILLFEHDFKTGMLNGNSVGNLYYSNYYYWQAEILEQYLFGIIPELLKGNGRNGEFITVETNVQHLQEAMPFEKINVCMYLDKIFENGLKVHFNYYSKHENEKRKLAYGTNTVVFCKRESSVSIPLAAPIPGNVFELIMNRTHV